MRDEKKYRRTNKQVDQTPVRNQELSEIDSYEKFSPVEDWFSASPAGSLASSGEGVVSFSWLFSPASLLGFGGEGMAEPGWDFSGSLSASGKISLNRLGRNRPSRLRVSSHISSLLGSWDGGTRYPPSAMTRRMFFKLSGIASSYS